MSIRCLPLIALGLAIGIHCPLLFGQNELPCAKTNASGLERPRQETTDRRYAVEPGAWSSATVSLFNTWHVLDENVGRRACFESPDGKNKIEIEGEQVFIFIGDKKVDTSFGEYANAELGWAPDSSRLFVTWTDGGEEGQWRTYVYDVAPDGLKLLAGVQDKVRDDFEKRIRHLPIDPEWNNKRDRALWDSAEYCEPYNVVGSRWLNSSKELLVSVLVPNVSRCRYMSEFNVYRIAVPSGEILERYTAAEAHREFRGDDLPRIVR
jgi:hypothetical protein